MPLAKAPMARSGAATRSTGRRQSDSSPVRTERKGRPASAPASMRRVEPELPASRGSAEARQLSAPRPTIRTVSPSRSMSTPRLRRQARVEAQSAALEKPRMRVSPRAIAPRIAARWEIDLSPGTRKRPRNEDAFLTRKAR